MYHIPALPLNIDIETKAVLKKAAKAHQALAELKGVTSLIPNRRILLNTLGLQEAKDSSAIENIITTHDELYKSDVFARQFASPAAKEVHNYAQALQQGYQRTIETGLLSINHIIEVQANLEKNDAGFRKLPGTTLQNNQKEVVYTPPQEHEHIVVHMKNLEQFINNDEASNLDDLVKMAIIHHQFESIHPFYDGNGRTGRIINILYLVKQKLLDIPVLYLSRYINQTKPDYYRLLQKVRTDNSWEEWILYILEGIESMSLQTIRVIQGIRDLMQDHKNLMRSKAENIYSHDLLNTIFNHPYTKIVHVEKELNISRITATKYLEACVDIGLMHKHKIGRENYYINQDLFEFLSNVRNI